MATSVYSANIQPLPSVINFLDLGLRVVYMRNTPRSHGLYIYIYCSRYSECGLYSCVFVIIVTELVAALGRYIPNNYMVGRVCGFGSLMRLEAFLSVSLSVSLTHTHKTHTHYKCTHAI